MNGLTLILFNFYRCDDLAKSSTPQNNSIDLIMVSLDLSIPRSDGHEASKTLVKQLENEKNQVSLFLQ